MLPWESCSWEFFFLLAKTRLLSILGPDFVKKGWFYCLTGLSEIHVFTENDSYGSFWVGFRHNLPGRCVWDMLCKALLTYSWGHIPPRSSFWGQKRRFVCVRTWWKSRKVCKMAVLGHFEAFFVRTYQDDMCEICRIKHCQCNFGVIFRLFRHFWGQKRQQRRSADLVKVKEGVYNGSFWPFWVVFRYNLPGRCMWDMSC